MRALAKLLDSRSVIAILELQVCAGVWASRLQVITMRATKAYMLDDGLFPSSMVRSNGEKKKKWRLSTVLPLDLMILPECQPGAFSMQGAYQGEVMHAGGTGIPGVTVAHG
jgi:hypothetical protein